jgi:hypothetical protein
MSVSAQVDDQPQKEVAAERIVPPIQIREEAGGIRCPLAQPARLELPLLDPETRPELDLLVGGARESR